MGSVTEELQALVQSWRTSLEARHRGPNTINSYLLAVRRFGEWLDESGRCVGVSEITRRDVDGFIVHELATWNRPPRWCASSRCSSSSAGRSPRTRSTPTRWVDVPGHRLHIVRKGRKPGVVPFGAKAAAALDRYQRIRKRHRWAELPQLWIAPEDTDEDVVALAERATAIVNEVARRAAKR